MARCPFSFLSERASPCSRVSPALCSRMAVVLSTDQSVQLCVAYSSTSMRYRLKSQRLSLRFAPSRGSALSGLGATESLAFVSQQWCICVLAQAIGLTCATLAFAPFAPGLLTSVVSYSTNIYKNIIIFLYVVRRRQEASFLVSPWRVELSVGSSPSRWGPAVQAGPQCADGNRLLSLR